MGKMGIDPPDRCSDRCYRRLARQALVAFASFCSSFPISSLVSCNRASLFRCSARCEKVLTSS